MHLLINIYTHVHSFLMIKSLYETRSVKARDCKTVYTHRYYTLKNTDFTK